MTPLTEATIEQLEAALEAKRAEVEEPDYEAWRPALEAYCNIRGGTVNTPLCEIDKLEIRSLIAALPLAPRQVEAPFDVEALAREMAAYERAAKVARDYASKAKARGWTTAPDSAAKAAQHIASNIRNLKEQDHAG